LFVFLENEESGLGDGFKKKLQAKPLQVLFANFEANRAQKS
jgi:hypothetical protein